jgi:hypothetical protein
MRLAEMKSHMNTADTRASPRAQDRVLGLWLLLKITYMTTMLNRKRRMTEIVGKELK